MTYFITNFGWSNCKSLLELKYYQNFRSKTQVINHYFNTSLADDSEITIYYFGIQQNKGRYIKYGTDSIECCVTINQDDLDKILPEKNYLKAPINYAIFKECFGSIQSEDDFNYQLTRIRGITNSQFDYNIFSPVTIGTDTYNYIFITKPISGKIKLYMYTDLFVLTSDVSG